MAQDKTQDTFTFDGFEPSNTTPIPDVFFDELLSMLSGAEVKVMLYIFRRTAGFKKSNDAISLTQFEKGIITSEGKVLDRGCGLSRDTICKALDSLEAMGCIKRQKRTTDRNEKEITVYSIRFKGESSESEKSDYRSRKIQPQKIVGKSNQGSQENRKKVVGKSDLQETEKQETVRQEREYSARTREILALCAKTLQISIAHTPSTLDLAFKIEQEGATDESLIAVIERMKNNPYWKKGVPLKAIANNFSDEWALVQQERHKQAPPSTTPSIPRSTISEEKIRQLEAKIAAKKAVGQ